MFAKIISQDKIQQAPKSIYIEDTTIVNPTAEQYAQLGWCEVFQNFEMITEPVLDPETGDPVIDPETGLPVTRTYERPAKEFYYYKDNFTQKEPTEEHQLNWIEHTHLEVKIPEPIRSDIIVRKIRSKYSINDEFALQRQRSASPEKEADFNNYNLYCNQCKTEADEYIQRWREA